MRKKIIEEKDKQNQGVGKVKKYRIYKQTFTDFTEEGVRKDLRNWQQLEKNYREQIEYLEQIQEEISARKLF